MIDPLPTPYGGALVGGNFVAPLMLDRTSTLLLERLRHLARRKDRFAYDVRGHSHVTSGVEAPYATPAGREDTDLEAILKHALDHDAVVSGRKGPDGRMHYASCRLFTDEGNAMTFARAQGRDSVYNWNREHEIPVGDHEGEVRIAL